MGKKTQKPNIIFRVHANQPPHLRNGETIRVKYYNARGEVKDVEGKIVGGSYPNYTIEFKIGDKIVRAFSTPEKCME